MNECAAGRTGAGAVSTHPFRAAVESGQFDSIGEIFAEDGVLHSPITHQPYRGREAIAMIIGTVAKVLDDFHFVKEFNDRGFGSETTDHAFVFTATVDGLQIRGCDFVHTGRDGLIDEITVMMRPLRAVTTFATKMRAELSGH